MSITESNPRADCMPSASFGQERLHRSTRCIAAAYDSYLPSFEKPIPALLKAWDDAPPPDPIESKARRADALSCASGITVGRQLRSDVAGGVLGRRSRTSAHTAMPRDAGLSLSKTTSQQRQPRQVLWSRSRPLRTNSQPDFGTWKTPWGDINRYQRLTGDIVQPFNDSEPSIPVGFTSATWGSLASFGARPYPGTKKWYGTSGNSFVAVCRVRGQRARDGGHRGWRERKPRVAALQRRGAKRYSTGNLREVYFYRSQ